jgi:hypothetical protein
VKYVYALVGVAAVLFLVGGVGTIAAFVAHADPGVRTVFMWICLAGLVPTMALCTLGICVGLYDVYRYRIRGDERPSESAT